MANVMLEILDGFSLYRSSDVGLLVSKVWVFASDFEF